MIVDSIKLHNYRNYGRLELSFGPSVNIVYGNNAQGKTNLIEAINVCACITSHRTSKDRELIKLGENEYEIELSLIDQVDNSNTVLFSGFYTEKSSLITGNSARRVLKQDGIGVSRIGEYMGVCNTVIFAPEDLNIVKGAPSARRKFLNMMISKVSPAYFDLINRTTKLIDQKNTYLKSCNGKVSNSNDANLDFWDFSLSELTAEMIISRYRYICILAEYANKHHLGISGDTESLEISYSTITGCVDKLRKFIDEKSNISDFMREGLKSPLEREIKGILSDYILSKFKATRKIDIERGISSIGVNRDDIEIKLNNLPMRTYSSQGQQRTASLSLKLSELDIINQMTSVKPVLLLDEVFAELDVFRRVKLISGMTDAQIFITCTDKTYVEKEIMNLPGDHSDIRYFHVTSGSVDAE